MIKATVVKQSNYPVSSIKIKKSLIKFLESNGIVSDFQVEVSLVGEASMKSLAYKYLKENNTVHNVLSFPAKETKDEFLYPPKIASLGEIVICYPKALEEAKSEGKLIEERIIELTEHGALHLLGKHHK